MQNQSPLAPKLSVTVLNYNYGHYLSTCLESILKQTFTDFELILINDKSPDNSLEVIQPYLTDPRVRLVDHTDNQGFVRSLIEGSDLSRGEYITVISADDWILDPTAFEKQIAIMDQDADIAFVFNNYGCYENEQHCNYLMCPAPASYIRAGLSVFQEIIIDRSPLHSGTIIRKTAYQAIGGYDPNTHYAADTKMWAGLCHVGKVAYINDVLYAYRVHNSNMSRSKTVVRQSINEVLQLIEWSFGMLSPAERRNLDWLHKKAIRRALSSYSILFTFQLNRLWLGWYYFWIAMKIRPIETLFQKMILVLILRTVLGKRGYRIFEQITARFSKQTRTRLEAEILHTGVSR
jgi:glycosyltransferase involved in cell wall biosynthesis